MPPYGSCWPSYVYLCFLVCLLDPLLCVLCVFVGKRQICSQFWAQPLMGKPW